MMNEEEYKMQMNLSLSQIPPETPIGGQNADDQQLDQRMLTEIQEQKSSSAAGSHYEQSSDHSKKSQ